MGIHITSCILDFSFIYLVTYNNIWCYLSVGKFISPKLYILSSCLLVENQLGLVLYLILFSYYLDFITHILYISFYHFWKFSEGRRLFQ